MTREKTDAITYPQHQSSYLEEKHQPRRAAQLRRSRGVWTSREDQENFSAWVKRHLGRKRADR